MFAVGAFTGFHQTSRIGLPHQAGVGESDKLSVLLFDFELQDAIFHLARISRPSSGLEPALAIFNCFWHLFSRHIFLGFLPIRRVSALTPYPNRIGCYLSLFTKRIGHLSPGIYGFTCIEVTQKLLSALYDYQYTASLKENHGKKVANPFY